MKKFKKTFALLLAICLCLSMTATAFAKSTPSDGVVSPCSAQYPVEDNYNNVWLDDGYHYNGSFRVHNTHSGKIGITIQVESNSNSSNATLYITNPKGITVLQPLYAISPLTDKNKREFILNSGDVGYYTIHYMAESHGGMRINCWSYKWYD